jgi:SAM-dependent methyltransferase
MHAVNIPLEALPNRTHELPPPSVMLQVADVGPLSRTTIEWLTAHGRQAVLSPPETGPTGSSGRLWSPNPFLEEIADDLRPGLAIDLGCGTGRDAVYLASMGWRVRAIDVLPDAIERARALESQYPGIAGRIAWEVADLAQGLESPGRADLVTMFFFLNRGALRAAAAVLAPGGSVVLETFTPLHRERFGKPRTQDLVLSVEEAASLLPGLAIQHAEESWRPNGRHTLKMHWRSPS